MRPARRLDGVGLVQLSAPHGQGHAVVLLVVEHVHAQDVQRLTRDAMHVVGQPVDRRGLALLAKQRSVMVAEHAKGAEAGAEMLANLVHDFAGAFFFVFAGQVHVIAGEDDEVEALAGQLGFEVGVPGGAASDVQIAEMGDAQAIESPGQVGEGEVDGLDQAVWNGHGRVFPLAGGAGGVAVAPCRNVAGGGCGVGFVV